MKIRSALLLLSGLLLFSCKQDEALKGPWKGYPNEIGEIIIPNCATSGCHTTESKAFAGGLSFESWEDMMKGGRAGASVIPYRHDQSFLSFFINTDSTKGPQLKPTMPYNAAPLTADQQQKIRDWIDAGAPNADGFVKFSDNPARRKVYVTNQGCDLVGVIDAESGLIMRYVNVGQIPGYVESPHAVKISNDGKYFYVVFLANNPYLEIYSTETDAFVDKILIGQGDWNTLTLSPDGKYAISVAFNGKKVAVADLENRSLAGTLSTSNYPHGSAVNPAFNRLYVTQQIGDKLYRYDFTNNPASPDDMNEVDLVQGIFPSFSHTLDPHELVFTPDGSKYLVSCQGTREVRIFQAENDSLLKVVPVGDYPVEFSMYPERNWAFVTCMEDTTTWAGDPAKRGSVAIVDYNLNSLVSLIYTGYQPHGLSVDRTSGYVYVANRNRDPGGPAPHHTTSCAGRNGYVTIIDANSLQLLPGYKTEMTVDPYGVAVRR